MILHIIFDKELFKKKSKNNEIRECLRLKSIMPYINKVISMKSPRYQILQLDVCLKLQILPLFKEKSIVIYFLQL